MPTTLVLIGALGACGEEPAAKDAPPTEDSDTSEPNVLPIGDTSIYIPQDTAPEVQPDLAPDNWVYIDQSGQWTTSAGTMTGTLRLREYVDVLDTAAPVYECNVLYSLTGSDAGNTSCPSCDLVFDVEHFVTSGDPGACHDVDAPQAGDIWQLGYDDATGKILLNYHGTDVWLEWYDANRVGDVVTFDWSATLAIEVEDSGMMQ